MHYNLHTQKKDISTAYMQNLQQETGETLWKNKRNTKGNLRNTGKNMWKHQGKWQETENQQNKTPRESP